MREGKWTFYYNGGHKYIGEWKDDKEEGKSKLIFSDGVYYEGDFINNNSEGKGI